LFSIAALAISGSKSRIKSDFVTMPFASTLWGLFASNPGIVLSINDYIAIQDCRLNIRVASE
jgi:hypothetical protein